MPTPRITHTPEAAGPKLAALRSAWRAFLWLRLPVWVLGSLLLLGLLAFAGVPPLVKWQLQKVGSDKLGRPVTIGAVHFKPWSLELTIENLAVAGSSAPAGEAKPSAAGSAAGAPKTPAEPQLTIRRIYVNAELESLLRLAPVADAVTVEEPSLRLTRDADGRLDIDDVLARLKPPADAPASEPPKFALYNLTVSGGSLAFTDAAVKLGGRSTETSRHTLSDLTLAVPFLSSLASQREVKTAPRLAFTLDGSRFDSAAVGTPFAETRKTDASLKIDAFDLQPWLPYLPDSLPFRMRGGVLNAELTIGFEQTPKSVVRLSGRVTVEKGQIQSLQGMGGGDLLAFDRLAVTLADVRPLQRSVQLSGLELVGPVLTVRRGRDGQLNLMPPAVSARPPAARVAAASAPAAAASGPGANAGASGLAGGWTVGLARAAVQGGTLRWRDESLASAASIALSGLSIVAADIQWPFAASAPVKFKGSAQLEAPAAARTAAAQTSAVPASAARGTPPQKPAASRSVAGSKPSSKASTLAQAQTNSAAPSPDAARQASEVQPQTQAAQATSALQASGPARLEFSGSATDQAAQVEATLAGWPLTVAAPYLSAFLQPSVSGRLDAELELKWQAARPGKAQVLSLAAPRLTLAAVELAQQQASLMSVRRVDVSALQLDLSARAVKLGALQLVQPELRVERGADRRWMFERWLTSGDAAPQAGQPDAAPAPPKEATPWAVAIGELVIEAGALAFADRAVSPAVAFDIAALDARLGGLELGGASAAQAAPSGDAGAQPGPGAASGPQQMPLSASLRLTAGKTAAGSVEFKGNVGLAPVQAQGQLSARSLPLQAFEPYFGELLNVDVLRADTGFTGQLAYRQAPAGDSVSLKGDVTVEQFRANPLAPAEELLAWKSLKLAGLALSLEPGRATRLDVRQTALSDFFARIIVMPEGRINLQDLLRKPGLAGAAGTGTAGTAAPGETADATKSGAADAGKKRAAGQKGLRNAPNGGPAATAATAAAAGADAAPGRRADAGPAAIVNFGPIDLTSGRVAFSDRFIKPNYSANLTELNGRLSAFSSVPPGAAAAAGAASPMADLELRGRAEQSASLEIVGKLNPLADPLALDIVGKVRDLELPPLSPYAIKYAGYGITRGKLSMDVNYVITPAGQLTASNRLVLNQLSFGEKVEGAPASLPVKLAVALLADRNGTINLDLPIRGSLNDPQFSIGPLIVKALVNLVTRALTAPFSLLSRAVRGGGSVAVAAAGGGAASGEAVDGDVASSAGPDGAGNVQFAAGSAQLDADAKAGLDQIAKALAERPALKLTVVGAANLQAERDALKRERLDALLRAEKRRASGTPASGPDAAPITLSAAEYPALLKAAYTRAELPERPRNFIGLNKDLPPAEMEGLLLASIQVDETAARELAAQRGAAVKDYLAAAGLPAERLVLGAAKTQTSTGPWKPHAELNLAPR
ncbi:MAG: DUF748 domain-containing protein [Polaromonas sp.]|nr:DUF748 domain-containing protein [Polaromonas sp.]